MKMKYRLRADRVGERREREDNFFFRSRTRIDCYAEI